MAWRRGSGGIDLHGAIQRVVQVRRTLWLAMCLLISQTKRLTMQARPATTRVPFWGAVHHAALDQAHQEISVDLSVGQGLEVIATIERHHRSWRARTVGGADRGDLIQRHRMVLALKPGGALLVEEPDYISCVADPRAGESTCNLFLKVWAAAQAGTAVDFYYGRRLYADVCALGMIDVESEGRLSMGRGRSLSAQFQRLSVTQTQDRLLGTGLLSPDKLDTLLALFDDPNFVWMGGVLMAVWGRRPTG